MDAVNVNLAKKQEIEKQEAPETAGSIAQAAPKLFTPAAETAGSIACAAPSAAPSAASTGGSSGGFSAMG